MPFVKPGKKKLRARGNIADAATASHGDRHPRLGAQVFEAIPSGRVVSLSIASGYHPVFRNQKLRPPPRQARPKIHQANEIPGHLQRVAIGTRDCGIEAAKALHIVYPNRTFPSMTGRQLARSRQQTAASP